MSRGYVGSGVGVWRVSVGFMYSYGILIGMARPEIDDELIQKLDKIVDDSLAIPLTADRYSTNEKLRIVIEALEEFNEKNERSHIDEVYDPV